MAVPPEWPAAIRGALLRKALADAAQRAALARRLGLTANEVVAVQHLARVGELTPGQLGARLQLSSGGTAGLIRRMQRAVRTGTRDVELLEHTSPPGLHASIAQGPDLLALDQRRDEALPLFPAQLRYTDVPVDDHIAAFRRGHTTFPRRDTGWRAARH